MTDERSPSRVELERAFAVLGDRLVRKGVVADLLIVGGVLMTVAYDAHLVTRDVGAVFVPYGVVLEEARNVANEVVLPPRWLQEQASTYVSAQRDAGKREVFDHPGIRVLAALPEHVFAMKAFAAHARDEEDLRVLAELIGVTTVAAARQLCDRFFPAVSLPARSQTMLEELFGAG